MTNTAKLKWLGVTLAGLGAAALSTQAFAEDEQMAITSHGGLMVGERGQEHWFAIGGRAHFDGTWIDANDRVKKNTATGTPYSNGMSSGLNMRRTFLNWQGGVGSCYSYKIELSFAPNSDGSLKVKFQPTFINYSGFGDNINVAFGQIAAPFGLEGWSGTNDGLFLESSQATQAFGTSNGLGVYGHSYWDTVTLSGSLFSNDGNSSVAQNRPSTGASADPAHNDKFGAAARVTFAPVHNEDNTYHFGLSGWYQGLHDAGKVGPLVGTSTTDIDYVNPEARGRSVSSLIKTGGITSDKFYQWGAEAAGLWGPFNLQGEFMWRKYHRDSNSFKDPKFYGGHVQGGWMITGESRPYDPKYGTIGRPEPDSTCGAWELVARYSYLKLEDRDAGFDGTATGDILNGKGRGYSAGLNWYINPHVAAKLNYVHNKAKYADAARQDESINAVAARLQVVF